MKNRTVIGVICIVIAVVLTFLISPLVSRVTETTVTVPRLAVNVKQGEKIDSGKIENVKVKKDTIPKNALTDTKLIVGKTASANLFAGDYVTAEKISYSGNKTADDVITSLNGSKFAMSFTIDSFAAGLSGKIKNGDVISLVIMNKSTGKSFLPPEFKYVKVITTTTSGGVDQDKIVKNDNGSFDPPSTVTLLVNETQARLLAEYEEYVINCVLVYRGKAETAQEFLDKQDAYFTAGGVSDE